MVMTAITGADPLFTAVKDGILPVPDAGSPIAGLELVQLKLTPAGEPERLLPGMMAPSFTTVSLLPLKTVATGITVTLSVVPAEAHCPGTEVNV